MITNIKERIKCIILFSFFLIASVIALINSETFTKVWRLEKGGQMAGALLIFIALLSLSGLIREIVLLTKKK
jgi:hypothetical protein